ncbi:myb-like protein M [Stomoxys calcitrans]|uniref:myb-like protein M n=1 Tax=Stomoxys calcitrans TaxID=35570 RepID=UPI0027E30E2E|nr:myb-like protein M [Stomoxys calcitrans]XP_059220224.1 myb-like protein M [Stomoxys calcitrans]
MPWKPSNDFEEEVVNLQPDHDFIFGTLAEPQPQPFYPRPLDHLEYAANKRAQVNSQSAENRAIGNCNGRLQVISQVQRIAGTKPLGELPTTKDWDTDKNVEKEMVGMMRYFGLGPCIDEPLDEEVTIATHAVKKKPIEIVAQNGRVKVPLFFDDDMFKLTPKISKSVSAFESESNNNSLINSDISLNTSSSSNSCQSSSRSFYTTLNESNASDSIASTTSSNRSLTKYQQAQADRHRLLLEEEEEQENADITPDEYGYNPNTTQSSFSEQSTYDEDSFKTALNDSQMAKKSLTTLRPNAKKFYPANIKSIDYNVLNTSSNSSSETTQPSDWAQYYNNSCNSSNNSCSSNDFYPTLSEGLKKSNRAAKNISKPNESYPQVPSMGHCENNGYEDNSKDFIYPKSAKTSLLQRCLRQEDEIVSESPKSTSSSSSSPISSPSTYANIAKQSPSLTVKTESPGEFRPQSATFPALTLPPSLSSNSLNPNARPFIIQPSHLRWYTAREIYEKKRNVMK